MAKQTGRENSSDEIKRGQAFSLWIREGLTKKRWKIVDLHTASGVSKGYLGLFINKDGILSTTGAYQRPGEEIIQKIAVALDIDESEGRKAAGYAPEASTELPSMQHYTIGQIAGFPVELSLRQAADEDQLKQLQLAVQIIFHKSH